MTSMLQKTSLTSMFLIQCVVCPTYSNHVVVSGGTQRNIHYSEEQSLRNITVSWPRYQTMHEFKQTLDFTSDRALLKSLLKLVADDYKNANVETEGLHEIDNTAARQIELKQNAQKMNAEILLNVFDLWKDGSNDITLESLPGDLQEYWITNSYKATWPAARDKDSVPMEFTVEMQGVIKGFNALHLLTQRDELKRFNAVIDDVTCRICELSWLKYAIYVSPANDMYHLSSLLAATRSIYHLEAVLKNRNMFTGQVIRENFPTLS